jgi:putative ABC transport system ATP-binding protein
MIKAENLNKIFKKNKSVIKALDHVSLEVEQGEWLGITGPSGSGKSTLLLALAGLIQPESGSLFIGGEDILVKSQGQKSAWRQANIGMVFQEFYLLPYLTVLENVMLAGTANYHELKKKAVRILESVGLSERAGHRPEELSVGQRQKTAIARAVINDPGLLLIDEPTGNLDPESSDDIMQIFKKQNESGTTLVLVSHNPAIIDIAGKKLHLEGGRLSADM